MSTLTQLLPSILVVGESIRASCAFSAFRATSSVAIPWIVLFSSELLKLFTAVLFAFGSGTGPEAWLKRFYDGDAKKSLIYAIPAALYFGRNLLAISLLRSTTPAVLQVCMLSELPAMVILHHFLIKRQRNLYAWISLGYVVAGLFIFHSSLVESSWDVFIILSAGIVMSLISAAATISTEFLIKSGPFWESQIWLSLWGVFFSVLWSSFAHSMRLSAHQGQGSEQHQSISGTGIGAMSLLVVTTAGVGLTGSAILRKEGSLAMVVASAASILASHGIQSLIFPDGSAVKLTGWNLSGGVIAAISTCLYSKYQCLASSDTPDRSRPLDHPLLRRWVDVQSCDESSQVNGQFQHEHQEYGIFGMFDYGESALGTDSFFGKKSSQPLLFSSTRMLCAAFLQIMPSFVVSTRHSDVSSIKKPNTTSYLDGLRGIASLCVVFHHMSTRWFPHLMNGWDGKSNNSFLQLPWIRIVDCGHPWVATFFVISGFSLTYKPLKLLRARDFSGSAAALSSSIFRRHLRLNLPCTILSFFWMVLIHFRLDHGNMDAEVLHPFSAQLSRWLHESLSQANPLHYIDQEWVFGLCTIYDTNMWSIPVEFRGSMVAFLVVLACSQQPSPVRLIVVGGIGLGLCYYVYWDCFLFIGGILLAELHLIRRDGLSITTNESTKQHSLSHAIFGQHANLAKKAFWSINLLLATYIFGMPAMNKNPPDGIDPGYAFFRNLIPPQYMGDYVWYRFWAGISALYLVFILDNAEFLQSFFTSSIVKYLGRISFSLYLVHGPMLRILGMPLVEQTLRMTGSETELQHGTGILLGLVVLFPAIIWAADVVARLVDEKCVDFTRWSYDRLLKLGASNS